MPKGRTVRNFLHEEEEGVAQCGMDRDWHNPCFLAPVLLGREEIVELDPERSKR